MSQKTKLELTWTGKENRRRVEPRILLEDKALSYRSTVSNAPDLVEQASAASGSRTFTDNLLVQGDNLLALKAWKLDTPGKSNAYSSTRPTTLVVLSLTTMTR